MGQSLNTEYDLCTMSTDNDAVSTIFMYNIPNTYIMKTGKSM